MKYLPTLWPFLKQNVVALAALLSIGVMLYGFTAITINAAWWLFILLGLLGTTVFGITALVTGNRSRQQKKGISKVVGGVSLAIVALVIAGSLIVSILLLMLLIYALPALRGMA